MALNRHLRADLKRKLSNNELTLGSWLTINHQSVVEIMATAGFEWLCIDIEHSAISISDVLNLIGHIQGNGMQALVRVSENNPVIIKQVMDAGADGVIVPMVNSLEEAKKAISSVKYPPLGSRGVGLSRAQGYGFNFENYRDTTAKEIKLIVQIEHIEAINNLEEILSLEHIDGTFIGPYDLSGSMGKPGDYNDNDVKLVLKNYEEISSKFNKLKGVHVIKPDYKLVIDKINKGYDFIAFSLDSLFLGEISRKQINNLKKHI